MLASPHDALRRGAMKRLLARDRDDELRAALDHLDEPRTPYAGDGEAIARARVAASSGVSSRYSAASAGALAWALAEGAGRGEDVTAQASAVSRIRTSACGGRRARDAEVQTAHIAAALADRDDVVRAELVRVLASRKTDAAAREALDAIAASDTRESPPRSRAPSSTRGYELRVFDPAARAAAIAALDRAGMLGSTPRAEALADGDPWIRAAALNPTRGGSAQGDRIRPCAVTRSISSPGGVRCRRARSRSRRARMTRGSARAPRRS